MKKLISIVLAILLSMMLVACATPANETPDTSTPSQESFANGTAEPGESAEKPWGEFVFPAKSCIYAVAASAGGGFDVFSRAYTNEFGAALGTTFEYLYEEVNSYVMGMHDISTTAKGEYAIMCGFAEAMQSAYIFQNAPYTLENISIIGNMYTDTQGLLVRLDDNRWSSMSELIEYGKTCTDPITISTPQALTPANIAAKVFVAVSGINATVIEYSGGSGARNDLIGGHVDISVGGLQNAVTLREQVKVIGCLGPDNSCKDLWDCEVSTDLPFDLPDTSSHCMLWCSKKLETDEPEVYQALVEKYKEVIASEAVLANLTDVGQERFVDYKGPEESLELCKAFADTLEKYRELLDPAIQQ